MKTDKNFRLSKSSKRLLTTCSSKAERTILKNMLIQAEVIQSKNTRMTMMYDINPNGTRPKKVTKEKEKEFFDISQNTPLKII